MDLKIRENETLKNTAMAALVGASAGTLCNYATQHHILKHPEEVMDTFNKYITELSSREAKTQFAKEMKESRLKGAQEYVQNIQELIKSGKIDNKMLAKAATGFAIVAASGYIVYKGIKSFLRNVAIKNKTASDDNL